MTKAKSEVEKVNVKRGEFEAAKKEAADGLSKLWTETIKAYKDESVKASDALDGAKADLKYAKTILEENRREAVHKMDAAIGYFHQAEKLHMKALAHYRTAISIYIAVPILAAVIWGAWLIWG